MNTNQKLLTSGIIFSNPSIKQFSGFRTVLLKYFPVVLSGILGLVFLAIIQIVAIGIADRLGVSPKTSLLATSLLYFLSFTSIAIYSGGKVSSSSFTKKFPAIGHLDSNEPVCKILIIKRKGV